MVSAPGLGSDSHGAVINSWLKQEVVCVCVWGGGLNHGASRGPSSKAFAFGAFIHRTSSAVWNAV